MFCTFPVWRSVMNSQICSLRELPAHLQPLWAASQLFNITRFRRKLISFPRELFLQWPQTWPRDHQASQLLGESHCNSTSSFLLSRLGLGRRQSGLLSLSTPRRPMRTNGLGWVNGPLPLRALELERVPKAREEEMEFAFAQRIPELLQRPLTLLVSPPLPAPPAPPSANYLISFSKSLFCLR